MAETDLVAGTASYLGDITVSTQLKECVSEADELVKNWVATATVPQPIYNKAVIKVAAELWEQRAAPSGIRNFGDVDGGQVVRIARDPMVAARPLLAPFLPVAL